MKLVGYKALEAVPNWLQYCEHDTRKKGSITLTLMYEIHFNAPIIDGLGIAYPVYRTRISSMRPATVCAGAGSPKAAATARNHAFITNAMVKMNRKNVLR